MTNSQLIARTLTAAICLKYIDGFFADWFNPSARDLQAAIDAFISEVVSYGGEKALAELVTSKKLGEWDSTFDEVLNEFFLDQPENNDYMEW
jgi:hypothetical protein